MTWFVFAGYIGCMIALHAMSKAVEKLDSIFTIAPDVILDVVKVYIYRDAPY
jgi:hypothetical protein